MEQTSKKNFPGQRRTDFFLIKISVARWTHLYGNRTSYHKTDNKNTGGIILLL